MERTTSICNSIYSTLTEYLKEDKSNKVLLILAIILSVVQFGIFKYYFVYPNFIHGDSFVYIGMAGNNPKIGTYPIGYPMFLRLFSVFSKSAFLLVFVQYFLLQLSLIFFSFTVFALYKPKKLTRVVMTLFLIVNPISLLLANYISSDCFFLALSLIWFTQIIWQNYIGMIRLILVNAILLVVLFMIRYNALFYPLVAALSILFSRRFVFKRIVGLSCSLILIFLFIRYTGNDYKRLTGQYQFSPFSGWQLANNALYAYRHVDTANYRPLPRKFDKIDRMVRTYFDTTRDVKKFPTELLAASTVYMWHPNSPLSIYADSLSRRDSTAGTLKKWATAAPMMKDYGITLIKTYPVEYVKYYLIPNSIKYYTPPVEFLEVYNNGVDTINDLVKSWFNYRDNKLHNRITVKQITGMDYYPLLVAAMNVVLVLNLISYYFLRLYKIFYKSFTYVLLFTGLWAINLVFSIVASPIALRFQLFPIIVGFSGVFLLCDYIAQVAFIRNVDVVDHTLKLVPDENI